MPLDTQHEDDDNDNNDHNCSIAPNTNIVQETAFATPIPTKNNDQSQCHC